MKIQLVSLPKKLFVFACAALVPALSLAQNSPNDAETNKLETITVTGSRISNPNVISPQPVATITAADIKALGATNLGDLLTRLPQLATTFTMGNSGGAAVRTAGLGAQDLRNLGPSRTLVLINGHRVVSGNTDIVTVDTNLIPVEMIDRIEVLTGGASAVYGADAVSGVINFILKDHYEGTNLHVQLDDTQKGSWKKYFASFTSGGSFAGDRGHFIIDVEHQQWDPLFFHSIFGNEQYTAIITPGNQYNRVYMPGGSWGVTEGGEFKVGSTYYVFNPDGSVRPQRFDGLKDSSRCTDCDYLKTNQVVNLQNKYNRSGVNLNLNYDLSTTARLYLEGSFNYADVTNYFQPAFGSGGFAGGGFGGFGGAYQIMSDNAYVSPQLAQLMNGQPIYLNRFDVDAGGRNELDQRQTGRVVFGIKGVFHDDWQYDAYGNYGVTQVNVDYLNNRNVVKWYASLDAVKDPTTGKIVCRSSIDPNYSNQNYNNIFGSGTTYADVNGMFPGMLGGCVPTSIFGDGAVNTDARNWFNTTTYRRNKLTEKNAAAVVTNNNLFGMPMNAGDVSLVLGAEYRSEAMTVWADPLDLSGITFNNAIPGFGGSYSVKEAFSELGIPLIADKPFFKQLGLDMAVRESDYSTAGHTETWKIGLEWALDDNIRLRGTRSFAVRAPNVSELFSGKAQNFFGGIQDPCSTSNLGNAPDQTLRAANCAALGVPPGEYPLPASVPGFSGSNPDLAPERAKTLTYGVVLTPQFVEGLSFNADYWNIKLANAIGVVDAQTIVDNCVDSKSGINNTFCANMGRDSNHFINFINQVNLNLQGINTSGIDFAGSYTRDIGPGKANIQLNATRTLQYTIYPFQTDPTQFQKEVGTDGFPKWKVAVDMAYAWNEWLFSWDSRYFSSMLRTVYPNLETYYANPYAYAPSFQGARIYHDMQIAWGDKKEGMQLYFGMHNVFDRKPPFNIFGTTFGGGLYGNDAYGRQFYAGLNYHF